MSGPKLPKGVLPLAILILGVVGAVLMIKLRPEPPKRPAMTLRPMVRVQPVAGDEAAVLVTGYGTVRSRQRVQLTPQVSGTAVAKSDALETGGAFRAGDVLLRIDDTDYAFAVDTAAAAVAAAEYELARAEQEAAIARREWEEIRAGSASDAEPNSLVLHGPQLKLARANLASARAALAKAELDLSRCTLTAPFDGRVVAESVDVGQYVRTGVAVGEIYAVDSPEVTVPLEDADLAFFDLPDAGPGAPAEIVAEFAGVEHVWRGHVARVSGALDEQTRMVDVVVAVDDDPAAAGGRPALLEGLFVEVRIQGRPLAGAVDLPRAALRDGDTVWLATADGRLHVRDVVVARKGRDLVLVTGGLSPGDAVIVSNLEVATEGMEIRVAGKPAPEGGERQ